MTDAIVIYGSTISPFVRKVWAAAAELGLAVETRNIGLGSADVSFREASPFGKIPALAHGDFRLADSSAIAHYLDALVPTYSLIPNAAEARAKTVWWDEFADTILFAPIAKMFFNRVVAPRFMKQAGDQAAADAAEATELPPLLDWLEGEVKPGEFLVGEQITLADLSVACPFANLGYAGFVIDPARWPRLAQWAPATLGRACFAEALAKDARMLGR